MRGVGGTTAALCDWLPAQLSNRTVSGWRSLFKKFRSRSGFHSFDVRAELAQLLIEMFVAAIDMIDAADFGHAIGL
jgi:hypothetical protein